MCCCFALKVLSPYVLAAFDSCLRSKLSFLLKYIRGNGQGRASTLCSWDRDLLLEFKAFQKGVVLASVRYLVLACCYGLLTNSLDLLYMNTTVFERALCNNSVASNLSYGRIYGCRLARARTATQALQTHGSIMQLVDISSATQYTGNYPRF